MKIFSMTAPTCGGDGYVQLFGSRIWTKAQRGLGCLVLAMTVAVSGGTLFASGPEPVELGTAADFGALAGAAVSGTGHVKGDVGAVGAIAPAITSTGTIYPMGHPVVMSALDDFAIAYDEGMNRPYDELLSAAAYG